MRYPKQKILASSLDWYMEINGIWIQGVSLGGVIPDQVDDVRNLPLLQALCSIMPDVSPREQIELNESIIRQRHNRHLEIVQRINGEAGETIFQETDNDYDSFRERYAEMFINAAQKGFYSYARTDIDNPLDPSYFLIAKPTEEAARELSDNMQRRLSEEIYITIQRYMASVKINDSNIPAPAFSEALKL